MRDLSSTRPLSSDDVDKAIVETREKVISSLSMLFVCSKLFVVVRFSSDCRFLFSKG